MWTFTEVRCAACQVLVYEPLDKSYVYRVILPSSLARGGAGLGIIAEKKVYHKVGDITDDMAIAGYFKATSPITTGEEKRITFTQKGDRSPVICGSTGDLQALNMLLVLALLTLVVVK